MTDKVIEASVVALSDLMAMLLSERNFAAVPSLTSEVLKSQGRVAAFSDAEKGILGCSLNAFKLAANRAIPGGFEAVNNLRISLLGVRSRFETSLTGGVDSRSKAGLEKKVAELEEEIGGLRSDLWNISAAFYHCLQRTEEIVSRAGRQDLNEAFRSERLELLARASLVQRRLRVIG